MGKFRYYVVYQRLGDYGLRSQYVTLDGPIETSEDIDALAERLAGPGQDGSRIVVTDWKVIQ